MAKNIVILILILYLLGFLFSPRIVVVSHDRWSQYGRVHYRGAYYELMPSEYDADVNGKIFINNAAVNER